jgi:uncharacterized protein (TIGR02145 family)
MSLLRYLLWLIIFIAPSLVAQVAITEDGSLPDNSAMLDIKSSTRGLLIPRMTTEEILAIPSPPGGMQVFCTTDQKIYLFVVTTNRWKEISSGIGLIPASFSLGQGGLCSNTMVAGPWITGVPLISANVVDIEVNVITLGSWTVFTDTVNGVFFSSSGNFSAIGIQTIRLQGAGTPLSATNSTFLVRSGSSENTCTFSVEVVSPPACGTSFTDIRNGKSYNTVLIYGQCWMAQNMNIGNRVNLNQEQTNNGTIEKSCFNNDEANCTTYGGLYQWAECVQYLNGASNTMVWNPAPTGAVTGICPAGWRLASQTDYDWLNEYLGGMAVSGGKMKEAGTSHWWTPNTGATNSSGFTALPAGNLNLLAGNAVPKQSAFFWTSTQQTATEALDNGLYYYLENLDKGRIDSKSNRLAVRCIKE